MAKKFYARRDLPGYKGQPYDRGQIIETMGERNDEKLIRLGYVAEVPRDTVLKECGECGGKFVGEGERNSHVSIRHKERFLDPAEEEAQAERRESYLETTAPLYLDKTKASREARAPEAGLGGR